MKKWIVSDIDGTLTNSQKRMSSRTKEVLREAQRQGIGLILASGRSPYSMAYFVEELLLDQYEGLGFCFNGSIMYDFKRNQVLEDKRIDEVMLRNQLVWAKQYGIDVAVYVSDQVISEVQNRNLTAGIFQDSEEMRRMYGGITYTLVNDLLALNTSAHKVAAHLDDPMQWQDIFLATGNPYHFMRVSAQWVETSPQYSNKGIALKQFCHHNKIDLNDVYIFGDGENDMPMFEAGINTIAMANALPGLKAIASALTLSNDEDGVAAYISEHLLST